MSKRKERLAEVCPDHEVCRYCEAAMCITCGVGDPTACDGLDRHCLHCSSECGPCIDEVVLDFHAEQSMTPVKRS